MRSRFFSDTAAQVNERVYRVVYKNDREREVVCPVYADAAGDTAIIIPDFHGRNRKYAIQVCIYAINLYCSNPSMGLRGAAEATRKEYGLKAFSPSTICRALKVLEQSALEDAAADSADGSAVGAQADSGALPDEAAPKTPRFPSAADTAERRRRVAKFIMDMGEGAEACGTACLCRAIVRRWRDRHRRLLL